MNWTKLIDPAWLIQRLTPMILRYALIGFAALLTKMGVDGDTIASLSPHVQAAVGALLAILVVLWGALKKTSVEAHDAAKTVDATLNAGVTVELNTPAGTLIKRVEPKASAIPTTSRSR